MATGNDGLKPSKAGSGLLEALSEAVESGAGLPAVARAAARVLGASVALIDRSSAVLAVAGASPDQERKLLAGGEGVTARRAAGGRRRRRRAALPRLEAPPDPMIARMVTTLLALELERSRSPEWESEEVAGAFVAAVLAREVTDRGDILARAAELGANLERGAGVIILRAAPRAAQTGEWRARVLTLALRALRSLAPARWRDRRRRGGGRDRRDRPGRGRRAARARRRRPRPRARRRLSGFHLTIGRSRRCGDPVDLYRAGNEARLAVNVGEAEGARCSPSRTPAPTACCCRR